MYALKTLGPPQLLAPGVLGFAFPQQDGSIVVPWLESTEPRKGNVRRYLQGLKRQYREIRVPEVISHKLAALLRSEGFQDERVFVLEYGEHADVMVWKAG